MDKIRVRLKQIAIQPEIHNYAGEYSVTPTEEEQQLNTEKRRLLHDIVIEAIPSRYNDTSMVDAGSGDIRVGKFIVDADGNVVEGTMPPRKPEQQAVATPTKQTQHITPDPDYAFSEVVVNPIPDEYQDVSHVDTAAADIRVGKVGVSNTGELLNGELLPRKPEQVKSAVPSERAQTITPDGDNTLSAVEISAIPDGYVQTNGATALAEDITVGKTAGVNGEMITGTKPVRTDDVVIDSLSPVPIPAGSYSGEQFAKISDAEAAKVNAGNIRKNVELFGVKGEYTGEDTLTSYIDDVAQIIESDASGTLPSYFFADKQNIVSISLPNVTTIRDNGSHVCENCANLEYVNFNSVTHSFDPNSFSGCTKLRDIDIASATGVGAYSFANTALTEVVMPNVRSIGRYAFSGCTSLAKLDCLGGDLLGANCMNGCSSLRTIIIRGDVITALSSQSAFTNTPFLTGGDCYIFVKQSMVEAYRQATNWSAILARGNVSILPIEGSQYEDV